MSVKETEESPARATRPIEPLAPSERRGLLVFGIILLVCLVIVAGLLVVAVKDKNPSAPAQQAGISGTPGTWAAGPDAPGPTDGFILTAGSKVIAGPKGANGLNPWTVYVYDVAKRTWKTYPGPAGVADQTPYARVWDGTEMLVFGGFVKHTANHHTVFDTSFNTWAFDPTTGAWSLRHVMPTAPNQVLDAVWTGQVVVLFAGGEGGHPATFEYDPANDAWSPGYAPMPGGSRIAPSVVWTGGEVLAWGGVRDVKAVLGNPRAPRWRGAQATSRADGYAYSPTTHKWTPISTAPVSAVDPATTWTGTDWVLYGGTQVKSGVATPVPGGYSYDPGTDTWTALPDAPFKGLSGPVAAWTGDTLVVWGRDLATSGGGEPKGAVFDPARASWDAMDASSQVAGQGSVAQWTGSSLLVVGGGKPGEAKTGHTEHVAEWKPSS